MRQRALTTTTTSPTSVTEAQLPRRFTVWAPRSRSTCVAPAVVSNRSQRSFKGCHTGLQPRTPWSSPHSGDFCTLLLRRVSLALHPQHDMIRHRLTGSLHALRRLAKPTPHHAPVCFVSIGCYVISGFAIIGLFAYARVFLIGCPPMPLGVHRQYLIAPQQPAIHSWGRPEAPA